MQMPQKSLNLETYPKNLESRSERTLICFSLVFQEVTLSRHWSDNKTLNKEFYLYTVNRSIVNERDDARSRAAVVDYIRKKKDRSGSSLSVHSNPNVRSPSSNDRPVSVISSRSLPTPVMSQKTIEEVLDNNLLQNFSQWAMAFNYKLSQVFVSITYLY